MIVRILAFLAMAAMALPGMAWAETTTLFALDGNLEVEPQMADKWTPSGDKLTWTFTLRDGLEFHDGTPVTAEDVIPSRRRWAVRKNVFGNLESPVAIFWNIEKK